VHSSADFFAKPGDPHDRKERYGHDQAAGDNDRGPGNMPLTRLEMTDQQINDDRIRAAREDGIDRSTKDGA